MCVRLYSKMNVRHKLCTLGIPKLALLSISIIELRVTLKLNNFFIIQTQNTVLWNKMDIFQFLWKTENIHHQVLFLILQDSNTTYIAFYLLHIFREITHLLMCCYGWLSVWGMAHHSHAHGQHELSCTAGVMLNIRWSDRNANQVSKLTLHFHRCT